MCQLVAWSSLFVVGKRCSFSMCVVWSEAETDAARAPERRFTVRPPLSVRNMATALLERIVVLPRCTCSQFARAWYSSTTPRHRRVPQTAPVQLGDQVYTRDHWTNVTPTILSKVGKNLHLQPHHPLAILRERIEDHFSSFKHLNSLSPVVTTQQNFEDLGFPKDHPGRSVTDSYYLNETTMLRTHTSAHEVDLFRSGLDSFLLTADVYRRDEIDRSHYPVFHQVEGCHVTTRGAGLDAFERENAHMRRQLADANIVITDPTTETTASNPIQSEHHTPEEARIIAEHLKNSLNSLVLKLFGGLRASGSGNGTAGGTNEPLQVRWIEATFPWTAPSYEVEVLYDGKWLEILGCGVVKQDALVRSGVPLQRRLLQSLTAADPPLTLVSRRTREARLGIRTRPRTNRHGPLLSSRHPPLLVRRPALHLAILVSFGVQRGHHHIQTLLEIPGMLQRFQFLD